MGGLSSPGPQGVFRGGIFPHRARSRAQRFRGNRVLVCEAGFKLTHLPTVTHLPESDRIDGDGPFCYELARRPTASAGPWGSATTWTGAWRRVVCCLRGVGFMSAMSLSMRARRSAALSRSIAMCSRAFLGEKKLSHKPKDSSVLFWTVRGKSSEKS